MRHTSAQGSDGIQATRHETRLCGIWRHELGVGFASDQLQDMCLSVSRRHTHGRIGEAQTVRQGAPNTDGPRAPVFTSPTVACLNRPYRTSLSSSVGSGLSVFASSAAASKSSCSKNTTHTR